MKECLFDLLTSFTTKDHDEHIASTLWCLWRRRNEVVWENSVTPIPISLQLSINTARDWQRARAQNKHAQPCRLPASTTILKQT
ncbi:hypothetical protein GmHk_18G052951 [Glycine max]|nr:hypothetical protein GmHk_18G052951 [Glycine max]